MNETNFLKKISFEDYKNMDGINQSALKTMLKSPLSYKHHHIDGLDQKDSYEMMFGRAVHTLLLEPELFHQQYVTHEKLKIRRGKVYDELLKEYPDKEILNFQDFTDIVEMCAEIREREDISKILEIPDKELAVHWMDRDTEITCKGLVDIYDRENKVMYDIKTTADASPKTFFWDIKKYGYHFQAAFYLDGLKEVTGEDHTKFIIIALEKKRPYNYGIYEINVALLQDGQNKYDEAIKLLKYCTANDSWPSYGYHELGGEY